MFECKLVASETQTAFGPLCLMGHYLSQRDVLGPLSSVKIAQKSIKHSPTQKLVDALMGILSGCKALYEIDVRVRPDVPLCRAFGRERVADQSTIQRTLNAFTEENVGQLRRAIEAIGRRYSAVFSHDFEREMLVVEVDLTGLRASKRSEGSTKGYFSGERNATGRQLVRASARNYGEVLFEKLHPGNTLSCSVLKETLKEVERLLGLGNAQRARTLLSAWTGASAPTRTWSGYALGATTSSSRATGALERESLPRACPRGAGSMVPPKAKSLPSPKKVPPHATPARPRPSSGDGRTPRASCYTDYLLTTFTHLEAEGIATLYDGRAGMEADIKGDKRGLGIEKRRKKSFHAQEAVVLLSQLAHNLLVWFERRFLGGTKAEGLGMERLLREVMAMPAEVRVGRLG